MKVLIVDDEKLTREGLLSSIDWNALGIHEILQADDGLNGLRTAQIHKPDIVLCDVRMPRLTGIEMAEKLENCLPDTSVIFMSGYSDKEYLKAAIKLKAIRYVEKPLNPQEIQEAVSEAIEMHNQKMRSRANENLYSMEKASRLAFFLTKPYNDHKDEISDLIHTLNKRIESNCYFVTYIVKLRTTDPDSMELQEIHHRLKTFLHQYHLNEISISTHAIYHVFHIFGNSTPSTHVLNEIDRVFASLFSYFKDFFITRGEPVCSIARVYQSYISCAALLQSSFFFKSGSILSYSEEISRKLPPIHDAKYFIDNYTETLRQKNHMKCMEILSTLYDNYFENRSIFENNIKDVYYKLLEVLYQKCQKANFTLNSTLNESRKTIIEYIQECFTFDELHQILVSKTEEYFTALSNFKPEDATIFLIKDYISKNYAKETLSIKEISDHVFLSASYVCTYFKNQTGQTLNQYLTDYRMDIAKQLLSDPRYQITDISSKVGYSNGNYFGKSFKKLTGLSPSKYREKILG